MDISQLEVQELRCSAEANAELTLIELNEHQLLLVGGGSGEVVFA